ncbi:MAG: hypothetical protein WDW36_000658 [Sanguina aurantia]
MSDASPVVKTAGLLLAGAGAATGAYAIYSASSAESAPSAPSGQSSNASAPPPHAVTFWNSPRVRDGLIGFAGVAGAVSVGGGAIGFHGLKKWLGAGKPDTEKFVRFWEIAVSYALWHSAALMGISSLPLACAVPAGLAFATGIMLFSGSIFAYVLTGVQAFQYMTPFGGIALMAGWSVLGVYFLSRAISPK